MNCLHGIDVNTPCQTCDTKMVVEHGCDPMIFPPTPLCSICGLSLLEKRLISCPRCSGNAMVTAIDDGPLMNVTCNKCDGTGKIFEHKLYVPGVEY